MSYDLHIWGDGEAVISQCGQYRYWLRRRLTDRGPTYLFAGVNPSTADARIEDTTSRKWRGFVQRWGGSGYIAVNPFAYRTTYVTRLGKVADPVGPANPHHLFRGVNEADILVPCWGRIDKVPLQYRHHFGALLERMQRSGKPVMVFGRNQDGSPIHPLMLGYATPLVPYRATA